MRKQVLQIEGMSCQNCAKHVEEAILTLPGIKKATVQLKKHQATVTYDEQQVADDQIANQINTQTHYQATVSKTKHSLF